VVVFNSIPHYRSLKNAGNYSLCHRRHEMKTCNNYCLSTLCPRQFTTAPEMFVRHLQSLGYCSLFPDDLSMTSYRCRPHERPGSSGQTGLVAATSQRAPFVRCLLHASKQESPSYIRVFQCVGGKCECTLVAGTQDIPLRFDSVD